ncbi:MAG: alpha/beta hydrolase [Actinobacteria bacterium]|nr:alpha/beta hydrolase [Actinomycetota bacterium]
MAHATNGGLRIYWDSKGSGSPVLLVMGAAYSSRMWYPVIDALAEQHRVIWFDNRGIGQSQATKTGTIQDMASDGFAVLDAAGVDAAHIYGASLGGVVVLQMALQSPERVKSLVVGCSGILNDDKPRAPKVANLIARVPRGVLLALGKGSYGSAASPEAVAKDRAAIKADKASATGLIQQQNALRAYSVTNEAIAGITCPALVLHGTEDKSVRPEWGAELADTLPHAKLVTYEGAGHNYLVSYPAQANADVLAFLASVD